MSEKRNQENVKNDEKATTHFGFTEVLATDKEKKVAEVFDSVASKYDLMNDIMSGGIHRIWKHFTIKKANVKSGQVILDLAGGTGDLAYQFYKKVGSTGKVILSDINSSMLEVGKEKLTNRGCVGHIEYVQANAENLPFDENTFDTITIAFGLRNVTDKEKALKSMYNCLKPGGKIMVLEFSKPFVPLLNKIYDTYSFKILPFMGKIILNDSKSYKYLAESIRKHPAQEDLKKIMEDAGCEDVVYHNLTGGIVALHIGYKY